MPRTVETTVYTYAELLALKEQHKGTPEGKKWSKAVDRAADWLKEGITDHDWWDSTYEMWKSALDEIGFEKAELSFSGFWSQGDGASFTSKVDLVKLTKFLANPPEAKDHVEWDKDGNKGIYGPYIVHKFESRFPHIGKSKFPKDRQFSKLAKIANKETGAGTLLAHVIRTETHYSHQNTCDFRYIDTPYLSERHKLLASLMNRFEKAAEEFRENLCSIIYQSLEEDYEGQTSDESIENFAEANEYTFDETGEQFG